jgi:hypothetical protein
LVGWLDHGAVRGFQPDPQVLREHRSSAEHHHEVGGHIHLADEHARRPALSREQGARRVTDERLVAGVGEDLDVELLQQELLVGHQITGDLGDPVGHRRDLLQRILQLVEPQPYREYALLW